MREMAVYKKDKLNKKLEIKYLKLACKIYIICNNLYILTRSELELMNRLFLNLWD